MQSLVKGKRLFQNGVTCVSISKLKIVFFLVVLIYILYLLLWSNFGVFKRIGYCASCSQNQYHSIELLTDHVSFKDVRFRNININLRTLGPAESIEELDFLFNVRKLIVYATHELNRPLKYTSCAKWWANPLDLVSHEERSKSHVHTDHFIQFLVQPGNLRVQATIRQHMPPIDVNDQELQVMGSIEIEKKFEPCHTIKESISEDARATCLCSSGTAFDEFTKITGELRSLWNYTDRELFTWHPDKSFYVGDYMNFTDYEWFVRSPGNSTQEVTDLHYSTEYCGPDIKMLVMISSAPGHSKHRQIIRDTFGSPSNLNGKGIKLVFLMGIPTDAKVHEQVTQEAEEWQDIIQANFGDSYHNLTISHLSMYKWAHLTCIGGKDKGVTVPPFILKADDDFLLNVELALDLAQQNTQFEFIGCLFCGTKVIRNVAYMKKYYTPRYMHLSESYAGYLSGVVYLLRTDVIPRLLHMSITTPMIHMDDAYVSGILLRQLNMYPRGSRLLTYGRTEPDACLSKKTISSYVLNPDDMTTQWKKFVEPIPANCTLKDIKMTVDELDSWTKQRCFFK